MAQDVFSKMAEDPWILNEDGYLKVETDVKEIIYHPSLNVILICTNIGVVRVLDVNSGVILQSSSLSAVNQNEVTCKYIPGSDRVLFCDGQAIGVRSDYNGVLLLDSILQKTLVDGKQYVKLELPLSEAVLLKQSLQTANVTNIDQVLNELNDVILNAQKSYKKGIKAQKWNTVYLNLPLEELRAAVVSVVTEFIANNVHTPELQVASAVQERLSELMGEPTNASDRKSMASEARRRETFSQWPHMDYKWALPEQMAQAGFYHQPNSSGDDRAMCFTCTVCLVCWERTDEPWSEHERHSPTCPFVIGEYTQNVPISVTNATNPAIDATYRGLNINVLGSSTVPNLLPTSNVDGLISVFDVSGKIKRTHSFYVTQFDSHILEKYTQDFGTPGLWNDDKKYPEKKITALAIVSEKITKEKLNVSKIRPTIVCGLSIKSFSSKVAKPLCEMDVLEGIYQMDTLENMIKNNMETMGSTNSPDKNRLYLVVYDFMYSKEQEEVKEKTKPEIEKPPGVIDMHMKMFQDYDNATKMALSDNSEVSDMLMENLDAQDFIMPKPDYNYMMNQLTSFYKTLIPGESDEVFLPPSLTSSPKKPHTGPRLLTVDVENTEPDSSSASDLLNGVSNGPVSSDSNEVSISDHIADLKNSQSTKKLNYSRAVQCVNLPEQCNGLDLEIMTVLTTHDEEHLLVAVRSKCSSKSFLLVYALDFTNQMVRINEESVIVKSLLNFEKPVEIRLLPAVERIGENVEKTSAQGIDGNAMMVCVDGAVRIVELATLKTICCASIEKEKFVSAAYCNSLDRLCASTKEGSLHFFALNDTDNESVDDHEEDDLFGLNLDSSIRELTSLDKTETIRCFREPPNVIAVEDLRNFQRLCNFAPIRSMYNVVVPPCWSEFQQAMRQRRNPSVLNSDAWTKIWRLQTDTTTWDEHIFEITLPSLMVLGHVDVHFTLQSSATLPHVEVTLLRQTKSGIGHNRDVKFAVDDTVIIDMLQWVDNPVVSEEYLRAHNADILAGPINIASHLDLTEQSGTVTLTSPRMFKLKVRNLLLHVRAVYSKDENAKNGNKNKKTDIKPNLGLDKTGLSSRKFYMGCDCIHELSLAIYSPTLTIGIQHEKTLRSLMLESNVFVQSLIMTAVNSSSSEVLGLVLDILNWIGSIRLTRNRSNYGEAPNHQLEFMFINGIEENMTGLIRQCLLLGGRSIAHKYMRFIVTCCSGAKNISKSIGEHFNSSVMTSLYTVLDSVTEVKSAAGLQWIFALLLKMSTKDRESLLLSKCLTLLKRLSDELIRRTNPYHLLLRSRYGLYGTPTEPELFDIDPPPYAKGSSILTFVLSDMHDGSEEVTNTEFLANYSFNKESINPRDVLSTSDTKVKYRNAASLKIIKGLIETEPLHFACVNTSEGTRLERADLPSHNVQTNVSQILPVPVSVIGDSNNKKEDLQQFLHKYVEKHQNYATHFNNVLEQEKGGTLKQNDAGHSKWITQMLEEAEQALDQKLDTLGNPSPPQIPTQQVSAPLVSHQNSMQPNQNLPWQQLLVAPPKQVIVVERMHSGARCHVTLDFGDSVVLTDILIPSCPDLLSLSIDVWLFGEEIDAVRIVSATDIGTKNLLVNDLQPPPLCKFLKITLVGRYGMSTSRCRIPLGYFYGHVVVLPEEVPHDVFIKPVDFEKQLNILSKLFEDISCRYSLACSKLKDLLQPFLTADMKNSIHLSTYMNLMKDKNVNVFDAEHSKIFSAYQETITYQRQLNTVRNVMSRLEGSLKILDNQSPKSADLPSASTDKLSVIAESLLEVILSVESVSRVSEETCQQLFNGLCISQPSRLQLLSAIFLEKSCGNSSFWGNFLADTLVQMFSTSCTVKFPQDRLFILIAFLSRKSSERSAIIDAALRVVYDTLKPLTEGRSLLLAVNIDLPLLSWLLMYLSLQLSLSRSSCNNRWNWVLGEMVGKSNTDNSKSNARKKTCKRLASTFGGGNSPILPGGAADSQIQSKLLATWHKHHSNKPNKITVINSTVLNKNFFDNKPKPPAKDIKEPEAPIKETPQPPKPPQYIDTTHCLAVAKKLLQLILCMDHSASHDMMLLSFKVVSRLVTLAKIQLGQLISESQLLELINFCLACKIPWAPFALACFLQESMELTMPLKPEVTEMDTDASTSSLWPQNDGDLVDNICEVINVNNTDIDYAEPSSDQSKSKISSNKPKLMSNSISFPPLPSVFESEDSDFEELLEDFEKVRCSTFKNPKVTLSSSSNISTTIDARLESGVYSSAEITLRRLIIRNTQKLFQNITAEKKQKENDDGLLPWPTAVGPFSPESKLSNYEMLTFCFEELFKNLQNEEPSKIEHILHLWLTLNCDKKDEKFDPSLVPQITLKNDSAGSLISALAWTPGLTLTTWCISFQALTLVCNTNNGIFDISGMASGIVNHKDFVQMFLSFLSGNGLVSCEKALAGPTLCKALHDLLVRLQMRCDIVSSSSKLGNQLKTLLLNVVYQLVKPGGPVSLKLGPLDAQCKLLQSMLYLEFSNIDISIGMSTLEGTAVLLTSYFLNIDKIKCNGIGEKHAGITSTQFGDIFDVVLGNDSDKQDRPVSHEDLLICLLKLLGKLVQTPIHNLDTSEAMDTEPVTTSTSQTDESKAEQIQQDNFISLASMPCFADTVLQHHPTVIRLCRCLAACKSSSLCMLANVSQKAAFSNLSEPNTVGDAVFHILALLAKKASQKELLMQPLLMFLSQTPTLSEPLIWFILQVLDNEEAIRIFHNAGGVKILATSIVKSSNTPSTICRNGTISTVMQHFSRYSTYFDSTSPTASATAPKKLPQTSVENSPLINFAPFCTITSHSPTAQTADVLIQGTSAGVTHRRARTPLWSYNFYPEETHIELILQLPSAVLLKEVHLQPHAGGLVTCPSYVSVETSANGQSRLVPACHPLPTSGLTFIRLLLPSPKVVNCVLIRLYKPRVGNGIGLLQIRLLGSYAFDKAMTSNSLESEDESHCNHSLGWLRLLHHCLILPAESELKHDILSCASQVPNLLNTCCGLLLVPSYMMPVYLPCLERLLRELALYSPENGVNTIRVLLENRLSTIEPLMSLDSSWQDKLMVNINGYQSACELLYQICEHQDANTVFRIKIILDWLQGIAIAALLTNDTNKCNSAYILCIASILWSAKQCEVPYELKSLITLEFFNSVYSLKLYVQNNISLKCSLNSLLCSICYIRSEFYPLLLQKIGVLVPNLSTDHAASISDDRKDAESMTDDHKRVFQSNSEWYGHLVIEELSGINLTKDQLETVALASRSPTAIQQLLDSGLPKLLNSAIYEFCHANDENTSVPMAKLENVTAILQFFTDVSDEKVLRDWLGSLDGSSFWLHLLHWLCKKPLSKSLGLQSEARVHLEEVCVKFLSKCCLCHPTNQARLAKVLCEVISLQQNGISGFLRRLILQLLLENEKVPVSIEADETLYKNTKLAQAYMPIHPAFKQTYNRAMLYLSTNTTLGDILENHVYFNSSYKATSNFSKKSSVSKKDVLKDFFVTHFSDLSMAAGVTAKDKRAKDIKNQASATPQSKKKRYTAGASGIDVIEGRLIKCEAYSDQPLPLGLNLGQVLRLLESKGATTNWPYIHLSICQSKISDNKSQNSTIDVNSQVYPHQPICSALQVFSSMGGLALLAQYLPTVYSEAMQSSSAEKNADQSDSDWIKLEECDDLYEDIEETVNNSPSKSAGLISHIPPHSLTAFSLFLRLPGYAEVLLKDMKKALCLLRLMLGVTDDGEGGDIFQSSVAHCLPTLPFEVLQKLYDGTPLCSDDGRFLRRISISTGVVHLLLACLSIFTHHSNSNSEKDAQKELKNKEDRQHYWAKGTGFGTGSTQQSWNVEQALLKQRNEEEHVTVLLQVLASYINPNDEASEELSDNVLPEQFQELLANSSLLPAISSYLRNDSVLDMARHIPLYKAVLQILRALAVSSQLVHLLLPQKSRGTEPSVGYLLKNMKSCVDIYASRLRVQNTKSQNTTSKISKAKIGSQLEDLEQGEGLATLVPDIQNTAMLVAKVTDSLVEEGDREGENLMEKKVMVSLEEQYLRIMKAMQFASYEMIEETPDGQIKFVVSHHFEKTAKSTTEQSHPARVKRIAQETVTLSTSLPLSYSSSVFVRYDTSRLDVMKVLITGPADTPYANGCFELDVFFPPDYPLSPMLINLETTGRHSVRFNPNLYNDGKVCLSVLNTWHGRPEEKWNAQTSSFLQVLVSIQSLILVPEPYFNEPGYERARGTPAGTLSSKDYNLNICQSTARWAMLDQIRNPCPCFKDVIHAHFYMKRHEIITQVDNWIKELEVEMKKDKKNVRATKRNPASALDTFKLLYKQLKIQLLKLKPPPGFEEEDNPEEAEEEDSATTPTNSMEVTMVPEQNKDVDTDKDMEKMVNDMCE